MEIILRSLRWIVAVCLTLNFARAEWIQSARSGDVAYFLFEYSPRIERYSLTNGQWLAPLNLQTLYGLPSTLHVDGDGIYVGFGKTVRRYDLNGSNDVHLINTADTVQGIFADGDVIIINHTTYLYARFTSLRKSNGTIVDEFENYVDSVYGASIAPSINKIFGRSIGISPADITYVTYDGDGNFLTGGDSPYHGDYPGAERTWVFPGDGKVVDSSGIVYSTDGLTFLNSFGGGVDDLAFYGSDIPIVLRGSELVAFSNSILPTGSRMLAFQPRNIYVAGTNLLAFTPDASQSSGVRVDVIPVSTLNPPEPGQPVDPRGLAYTADDAFVDRDGILYLFSMAHQSLFRWDSATQDYLPSVPLIGVPDYVAYSATNHRVYLAYRSGLIRQINLGASNLVEVPFVSLATAPGGLATAGPYLFAMDYSGAWATHYTFNVAGNLVESVDWNYYSREYVWSPANQKMYFFRDDTSPNDLLWEQINANGAAYPGEPAGGIGTKLDSPLHDSAGFIHPIRVAPDGSIVVLGSGMVHNAQTLARLPTSLGNAITDAAWVGGQLNTVRTVGQLSQYQQWLAPSFALGAVRQFPGAAHRLFSLGANRLLGISIQAGKPSFYVLDAAFNVVAPPVLMPPSGLMTGIASPSQVNVTWDDASGEESYVIERKAGQAGAWTEIGTAPTSATSFSDASVVAGSNYFYRLLSRNGASSSAYSEEVQAILVAPVSPTNFAAVAQSYDAIVVTWNDVSYETGYQLERRMGSAGSWMSLATLEAGVTSYLSSGLTPNSEYQFRVRAVNGIGASSYSAVVSTFTLPIPPTTPYLFSANALGPFGVSLNWFNSNYEDRYVIERRTTGSSTWDVVGTAGRDVTFFTDSTVAPVTTYQYRIYATNSAGASDYSDVRTVTTPEIPPPSAPSWLNAEAFSLISILVTWEDGPVETGYMLERRTDDPDSWEQIATLGADVVSYFDTNVVFGIQYVYRLQAFNEHGISDYSFEDDATPENIVNLIADDFNTGINAVAWADVSGGVATNGGLGFRGSQALWFGAIGVRSATTVPLDVSAGGTIRFSIRAGNEERDGELWNNSEEDDYLLFEYSLDGGARWNVLEYFDATEPSLAEWSDHSMTIPEGSFGSRTQFRWRQHSHGGKGYDTWALEDVVVRAIAPAPPEPPPFILSGANSSTAIALYWIGGNRAMFYTIERRHGLQGWTVLATVPATITYYTDDSVLPETGYTYRVRAANAGGVSPYSATTLAVTWSQVEEWVYTNYGSRDAMDESDMLIPGPDGLVPLLRYAFNLSADEPAYHVSPGTSERGFPAIWFDKARNRLCAEFVRRKASARPGITYRVQFCSSLAGWTNAATPVAVHSIDSVWERVRFEDTAFDSHTQSRFGRVTVGPE